MENAEFTAKDAKVTARAKEILKKVENGSAIMGKESARYTQLVLFEPDSVKEAPLIKELKKLNVEATTQLEALNALAEMKRKAGGG